MSYLKDELYALIKQDESIFDFIQTFALDGLWYLDLEHPEEEWMNDKFWITLGYDPRKMPSKSSAWKEIIFPEDLVRINKLLKELYKTPEKPLDTIVRYRHKTGKTIWIRGYGILIKNDQGKLTRMLGTHQDVTELKRKEDFLERSNAAANIGYWELEVDSGELLWSNETKKIHEVSQDFKPTLENALNFYTKGKNRDTISAAVENSIKKGEPYDVELEITTAKGNVKSIRAIGFSERNGDRCFRVYGTFQDITSHKLNEKILKKNNQKLERILNDMTDVIWSAELPNFKVIFVTPSAEKLYGKSVKQKIDNSDWWEEMIHPDDKWVITKVYSQIKKIGRFSVSYRIVTAKGEIKWVKNKGKVIYDEHKKPVRLNGLMVDISREEQAKNELNNELEFQELLIEISSAYIDINFDKLDNQINDSLKKIGKFSNADRAHIFKYDFDKGTVSNTYEWCEDDISVEIQNNQNLPIDYYIEDHKRGELFFIPRVEEIREGGFKKDLQDQHIKSMILIPMISGDNLTGFVGLDFVKSHYKYKSSEKKLLFLFAQMLMNVQNKMASEKKLKLQEERYRNIIANMNLGLIEVDNKERVVFANQNFYDISGFTVDELIGSRPSDTFMKNQNKSFFKALNKKREQGISDSFELKVLNKLGQERWWFISRAPNYTDEGKLTGSIEVHLDITEQKKIENELITAKHYAESAAKAKQLFLANMSHEIRTPLNVIIGMIRELGKEKLTQKQVNYIKQTTSSANHLLTILNNVLDIAKIETGKIDLFHKTFNLQATVDNVYSILCSQAQVKEIDLKLDYDTNIDTYLIGDEVRIRQVLINLVGNAIKFTEKGEVLIAVKLLHNKGNNQVVYFEVKDTGVGMSENFKQQIFDKFSQENDETNRRFEGSGLGMSISNDLVKMMGGEIKVESKKDEGSKFCFSIQLPVSDKKEFIPKNIRVKKDAFLGRNILLVDDNQMNRFISKQSLRHFGCNVIEANSGLEAINILKKQEFDLVLMDVQMPEMDGIETTSIIRSKLKIDIPIVALTANAFKEDIDHYLSQGMNNYIIKPYEEEEFFLKLLTFLNPERKQLESEFGQNDSDEQKLFDLSYLEDLGQGNHEFINEMINLFLEVTTDNITGMEKAFKEKDYDKVKQLAHKIKPSIAQMGITSLNDKVVDLEFFVEPNTNLLDFKKLMDEIISTLKKVTKELKP